MLKFLLEQDGGGLLSCKYVGICVYVYVCVSVYVCTGLHAQIPPRAGWRRPPLLQSCVYVFHVCVCVYVCV